MIALCEESKEAGIKTLVMLDDQGGQTILISITIQALATEDSTVFLILWKRVPELTEQ